MLAKILDFNIEDLIAISDDFSNIDGKSYNKKKDYLSQLLSCLWEIGLRNLFLSEETKNVLYSNFNQSNYEIEERLVEIYYGLQNGYINIETQKGELNVLMRSKKYRDFVKNHLHF